MDFSWGSVSWFVAALVLAVFLWMFITQELSFRRGRKLLLRVEPGQWHKDDPDYEAYRQWQADSERQTKLRFWINIVITVLAVSYLILAVIMTWVG